ncbi:SH3 domain-containing protein [Cytobacillus firmus]|uniref:SH3 domain-containing protein n=1 Tax=Cytobacillus firmus TaxID=1399 RepID=UPI00207AD547|nr:SH3 domain-containing protein [Cytobacillus firmus]USK38637.1 SH3 domain-containing protein [Cytobacillus firmus]
MKKAKQFSVYCLILLLILQYLPYQPSASALAAEKEPERAVVFAEELGGTVKLYEGESTQSDVAYMIEDDTEVIVLEEGLEFTFLEHTDVKTDTVWLGYVENSRLLDLSSAEEFRMKRSNETVESNIEEESDIEESNEAENSENVLEEAAEEQPQETAIIEDPLIEEDTSQEDEGQSSVAGEELTETSGSKDVQVQEAEVSEGDTITSQEEDTPSKTQVTKMSITSASIESVSLEGIALASPTHVYQEASTGSKALKSYSQGTMLKYETFSADWHRATVYISGKATIGYIKKSDVENIDSSKTNLEGVGIKSPTNIYSKASRGSSVLKTYAQGTILKYRSFTSEWYECTVYVNGSATIGYINKNDLEEKQENQVDLQGVGLKSPTKVYSSASEGAGVLKSYSAGTVLRYSTYIPGWYECTVYVNGKATRGFINASDVENAMENPVSYSGVGIKSPTHVYQKPSADSAAIKSYEQGSILKYQSYVTGWYSATVYINGKATTGYINANDVENPVLSPEKHIGVGLASPVKVYQKPSTSSSAIKSYGQGSILHYETFITGWYSATVYVSGKAHTGYIKASDVENSTKSPSNLTVWGIASKINVYSTASRNATILKSYNNGSELKVQTFTSSWYKATVYINGEHQTGYIHKDDVSTEKPGFLDLDLRKPAQLTAKDIENYFDRKGRGDSPLKAYAQNFINVQNKYGVNAAYLVAHAIWETGWGGSNLITYKNNLYGYGAYDVCPFTCGYYFNTIEESINAVAYIVKRDYLTPGGAYYNGPTLTGMNVRYATDQNWKNGISNLMEGIQSYDAKYYSSTAAITGNGNSPGDISRDIPAGKPVPSSVVIDFPEGISATINETVNFRSLPYTSSSTVISSLQASAKVTVLGYNTDVRTTGSYPYDHRWYRISVGGKIGWVYGKSLTIDNLLQIKGVTTTLNIRNAPNGNEVIGSAPANAFLKSVIIKGQPVSSNGWYNIYLLNSTVTGWVSGDYINEIHN